MQYTDNEDIRIAFKKLLIDERISQRTVAERTGLSPQGLSNLLNKKQLSFGDMKRLLDAVGYDLSIDFVKRGKDK